MAGGVCAMDCAIAWLVVCVKDYKNMADGSTFFVTTDLAKPRCPFQPHFSKSPQ